MSKAGLPPPKEKPPVKIEMMHPHQIILSEEVSVDKNDDSRLEEFRQLKRDIRGSTQHLVVGMDIAKERHHAFFGTPAGPNRGSDTVIKVKPPNSPLSDHRASQ
jgi:hypothetical protein